MDSLCFRPKPDPIEELHEFAEPIGKLRDPREAIRFIEWLPELTRPEHAYFAMLLVRAKEKRTKFGFRGKEKALEKVLVPGYLRNPKLRLYLELRRLALLAVHSHELYVYERHAPGTDEVVEVWRYPSEIVGILVNACVHDWVLATVKAIQEFVMGVYEYKASGDTGKMRRLDDRIRSLLPTTSAKGARRYFSIDVDDRGVAREILGKVMEYVDFIPARIETPRGMHILLSWEDIPREKREDFNRFRKSLEEAYGGLAEYKQIPQEPLPGTEYKQEGFIVRFHPPEK